MTFLEGVLKATKKLFGTQVDFDDGSHIAFFTRESIRYVEPDGSAMEIPLDFQSGVKRGRILHIRDVSTWDYSLSQLTISPAKRDEIIHKVQEYCRKRGVPLEIVVDE